MSKTPAVRAVSYKRNTSISSLVTFPASLLGRSRPPLLYKESICGKDDIPPLYKVTRTKKDRQGRRNICVQPSLRLAWLACQPSQIYPPWRETQVEIGESFYFFSNDTLQSSPMGAPTRRTTANAALVLEPGV